jgi:DNA-binding SARP family transcriptional activator
LLSFNILGPLEVVSGGKRIAVVGEKPPLVLALLLLRPGEEVSADSLIDALWADEAPATARSSLQVHVSKLRRLFAENGGEDLIRTRGSSYSLLVDPEQVDAWRFARLVAQGREALASDATRAHSLLTEALALWRGAPLSGLDVRGMPEGWTAHFEERWEQALALRAEASEALGLHAEAVADLETVRRERPLNERYAEMLALGLYRTGRASEALAVLADFRRRLSEELGLEPGPGLAETERRILANDPSLAVQGQESAAALREVRKTVTVVAVRLPGTDLESKRAATEALSDLCEGIADAMGGSLLPARSGRLLAVFGMPNVHEDDAERAVTMADSLRKSAASAGLEARVGIATGEVLVQVSGTEEELLTHDPVEVADQLARRSRPGEVLLGLAASRLVQSVAELEPAPLLIVDDEEGPLVAFRLLSLAAQKATRRPSAPLVGREREIDALRETVHRAFKERRPALVTLVGAAGIGKSRLIAAFAAGLGERVDVAAGRCLPYGRDIGFWAMAEVVRAIAGIGVGDRVRTAKVRLEDLVSGERDAEFLAEQLGALLGVSGSDPAPDETGWAIRRTLEIAARRRPLVVVVEDLQWADDTLLDLLSHVSQTASDAPLAIVCSARPELIERRPGWGGAGSESLTIRLDPLTEAESGDLLGLLLGRAEVAPEARDRISAAAEGNPLFLEELLSILMDDGHLLEIDGRWEAASDLTTVPLPPTVRALLEARVDRLPATERAVVEAASIVGREFDDEDLEDMMPELRARELAEALDALGRRDVIQVQRYSRPGSRSYVFRHILLRDVVYGGIPKDARALGHETYGRAMERRAGERLTEVQEIVGYHLETALRLRREIGRRVDPELGSLAAGHLASAGRRALGRDDAAAAASLFGRAVECVDRDDPAVPELLRLRGAALFDLGRFEDAEEALGAGLAAAERAGMEAQTWRLLVEREHVASYLRPGDKGGEGTRKVAEQAIRELTRLGDTGGSARAHRLLGEALLGEGRQDEAGRAFREGLRLASIAGDEREMALSPYTAELYGSMPLPAFIDLCESQLAELARPRPELYVRLGLAYAMAGRGDEAKRAIGDGLRRTQEVGGEFRVADGRVHEGAALLYLGDAEAAAVALEQAVKALRRLGEKNVRSTAVALLGEAFFRLGRLQDAAVAAEESREVAAEDDAASQMAWRQVMAKVAAVEGDMDEARRLIGEAVRIADQTDFLAMAGQAHLEAAAGAAVAGDAATAAAERKIAMELFERKGMGPAIEVRVVPKARRRAADPATRAPRR